MYKFEFIDTDNLWWEDEITLEEISKGVNGEDALVCILTNPTMNFKKGVSETETCEIVVQKGLDALKYGIDSNEFTVTLKGSTISGVTHSNGIVSVTNPSTDGKIEFDVTIKLENNNTKTVTRSISWKVISDGNTPSMSPTQQTITVYASATTYG
jgi:hypothetical protein